MQYAMTRLRYAVKDAEGRILCEDGFRHIDKIGKANVCMYQSIDKAIGSLEARRIYPDTVNVIRVVESIVEVV